MDPLLERLDAALRKQYPKALRHLKPRANDAAIEAAEGTLGMPLPSLLQDLYRWHDGWEVALVQGANLSSLEQALARHASLRETRADGGPSTDSWYKPSWFPLSDSRGATDYFVDLAADAPGKAGQIISWSREEGGEETGVYLTELLERIALMVEHRNWPPGHPSMEEHEELEAWYNYGLVRPLGDLESAYLAHPKGKIGYHAEHEIPTLHLVNPTRNELAELVALSWPKLERLILYFGKARLTVKQWQELLDPQKTSVLRVLVPGSHFEEFVRLLQGPLSAHVDRLKLYVSEHLSYHVSRYYGLIAGGGLYAERPAKARELLLDLVQVRPEDPHAWCQLGDTYDDTDDHDTAAKYWRKALTLDANHRRSLYLLGNYEMLVRNDGKKALEYLDRAVALDPNKVNARHVQAQAQMATGDTERARKNFTELIALYMKTRNAGGYFQVACIHCVLGNQKESLRWLAKAVKLQPSYAERAAKDRDFNNLKGDPEFLRLVR